MRIAIASRGMEVSPRYDLAEDLTCYNVDRGVIIGCQNMPFPKMAVSEMVETLRSLGIDVLIVGAIGYEVAKKFCAGGIEVIAGASGPSREVARTYLDQALSGVDLMCEPGGGCAS